MVGKVLLKNMGRVKWDQAETWSSEFSVVFVIKARRVKLFHYLVSAMPPNTEKVNNQQSENKWTKKMS